MAPSSNRKQERIGFFETARTGALIGLGFAALNLLVGGLGALLSGSEGAPTLDERTFVLLVSYVIGFVVAGAGVALLAVPLMGLRGGSYILFIVGSAVPFAFITMATKGFITRWSADDWLMLVVLSVLFGVGLRWLLGRLFLS